MDVINSFNRSEVRETNLYHIFAALVEVPVVKAFAINHAIAFFITKKA